MSWPRNKEEFLRQLWHTKALTKDHHSLIEELVLNHGSLDYATIERLKLELEADHGKSEYSTVIEKRAPGFIVETRQSLGQDQSKNKVVGRITRLSKKLGYWVHLGTVDPDTDEWELFWQKGSGGTRKEGAGYCLLCVVTRPIIIRSHDMY